MSNLGKRKLHLTGDDQINDDHEHLPGAPTPNDNFDCGDCNKEFLGMVLVIAILCLIGVLIA